MSADIQVSAAVAIAGLEATSAEEVLTALAERAIAAGWAKESFTEAVLKREAEYPTGLPTEIPVALPHTDPEHVLQAGLGIAVLKNPVDFGEMGGESGTTVAAQAVLLILVEKPENQVTVLGQLVNLIQRPGWFDALAEASTDEEVAEEFRRLLAQ